VEDIEMLISDYIRPNYVTQFAQEWETLEDELVETFALDKEKAPSLKGKDS
jgi:coatomer protein complex subunit gamma